MTIDRIDKAAARQISDATMEALRMVAEDLGLTVETKGGSFDPTAGTYSPKITFKVEGSEEAAFARDCGYVLVDGQFDGPRLDPSDYGKTFVAQGQTFTLVGVNLRAPKFPLVARADDGRMFKFPSSAIRQIKTEEAR